MAYPDLMETDEEWLHAIGELPAETAATGDLHRRHVTDALIASAYASRDDG